MTCRFEDMTLKDFIHSVASDAPTPGGGTVAAWCGVQSVALTRMVYALTIDKKKFDQIPAAQVEEFRRRNMELPEIEAQFFRFMEDDSAAFSCVMEAFRLPKSCPQEMDERACAIQDAYGKSAEVPLSVAKLAVTLFPYIRLAGEYGNKNAVSDAGVSALLAHAAVEGAAMNVVINASSLQDKNRAALYQNEITRLLLLSKSAAEEITQMVYQRIQS